MAPPPDNLSPRDPAAALKEAVDLLVGSGTTKPSLKDLSALVETYQKGVDAHGSREDAKRKDILSGVKYVGGLAFAVGVLVAFLAFCPADKRWDLLEKLIPFATGAIGLAFGQATAKKE